MGGMNCCAAMKELETRLTLRLGGMMAASIAVVPALRFSPPSFEILEREDVLQCLKTRKKSSTKRTWTFQIYRNG